MRVSYSIFLTYFLLIILVITDDSIIANQFYTNQFTDVDFNLWTKVGNNLPGDHLFTECGGQLIFGGYKVFGGNQLIPSKIRRQFNNLIGHYGVRIQAKIYKIDSWNSQRLYIMADNIAQKIYLFDQFNSTMNICGDPFPVIDSINKNFNDSIINVDFNFTHTSPTLDLAFETDLNSIKGWWGIRNIKISLLLCDKSCETCTNPYSCTSCSTSISNLALIGAYCQCTDLTFIKQLTTYCTVMPCIKCAAPCDPGYYLPTTINRCYPCNIACKTCTGPMNLDDTVCMICADGYFRPSSSSPCQICVGGCGKCFGLTPNSCLSCKEGYFLLGSQCFSSCPNGTWASQLSKKCYPCSGSCQTCNGLNTATVFYCLSCTSSLYLNKNYQCASSCTSPYYKYNNLCVSECPISTYINTGLQQCSLCTSNCLQCNISSCIRCEYNYYLYLGTCVLSCPITHFGSNYTLQCQLCHSDCIGCFGSTSGSCLLCIGGKKLINNMCYTSCPSGTYSSFCLSCYHTCLQCTGPNDNQCISCVSPYLLDLNTTKCLQLCQMGSLINKTDSTCYSCESGQVAYFHQCVPCSQTCNNCYGTSFLQCLTCKTNNILKVSTCVLQNQQQIIYSTAGQFNILTYIMLILFVNVITCIFFEIVFVYKTPLLSLIQIIQIISYFYLFSISFSQQVQRILLFFYKFNFSTLISIPTHNLQLNIELPVKINIIGKCGYYAIDTIGLHLIIIIAAFLLLLIMKVKDSLKVLQNIYQKINPFILSYLYRLVILDQSLSLIIFLIYGNISTSLGILSLIILIIDILLIGLTFFWKIKPINQQRKQYALFYFNQIKQNQEQLNKKEQIVNSNKIINKQREINQNKKQNLFINFIFYIGKIPFIFGIIYFLYNPINQVITVLGYSIFYLIILSILPYKRKIYKTLYILGGITLITTLSIIFPLTNIQNKNLNIGLQLTWIFYIFTVFFIMFGQIIVNLKYFIQFFKYVIHKLQQKINQQSDQQSNQNKQNQNKTNQSEIQNNQNLKINQNNQIRKQKSKQIQSYCSNQNSNTSSDQYQSENNLQKQNKQQVYKQKNQSSIFISKNYSIDNKKINKIGKNMSIIKLPQNKFNNYQNNKNSKKSFDQTQIQLDFDL